MEQQKKRWAAPQFAKWDKPQQVLIGQDFKPYTKAERKAFYATLYTPYKVDWGLQQPDLQGAKPKRPDKVNTELTWGHLGISKVDAIPSASYNARMRNYHRQTLALLEGNIGNWSTELGNMLAILPSPNTLLNGLLEVFSHYGLKMAVSTNKKGFIMLDPFQSKLRILGKAVLKAIKFHFKSESEYKGFRGNPWVQAGISYNQYVKRMWSANRYADLSAAGYQELQMQRRALANKLKPQAVLRRWIRKYMAANAGQVPETVDTLLQFQVNAFKNSVQNVKAGQDYFLGKMKAGQAYTESVFQWASGAPKIKVEPKMELEGLGYQVYEPTPAEYEESEEISAFTSPSTTTTTMRTGTGTKFKYTRPRKFLGQQLQTQWGGINPYVPLTKVEEKIKMEEGK